MTDRNRSPSNSGSDDELSTESEGWDDVESIEEDVKVKSLFDDSIFRSVKDMLEHVKVKWGFDFWSQCKALGNFPIQNCSGLMLILPNLALDDLDRVKFVNYLREQHRLGINTPEVLIKANFMDDAYLKPVLVNDPLLYYLEPEPEIEDDLVLSETWKEPGYVPKLDDLNAVLKRLENVQNQYASYRHTAEIELEKRWTGSQGKPPDEAKTPPGNEADKGYWASYSYHGERHITGGRYPYANHK
jgi:hypothetical protein